MQQSGKLFVAVVLSIASAIADAQSKDNNAGKAYVGLDFGYGETGVDVAKESN